MTRVGLFATAFAVALLLALPSSVGARTQATVLIASVGTANAPDAYRITLTDANGGAVTRVPAGDYEIQVHDYSTIHNFDFFGPGNVMQSTSIEDTGDATWNVTLVNGTYEYQCDAHASTMHGTLAVGPPPPKPTRLTATVAPGGVVKLHKGSALATSLTKGKYMIAVADRSKTENFHLIGPGVNVKTTLAFKGTKLLGATLGAGMYRYRSDAHPRLGKIVRVR